MKKEKYCPTCKTIKPSKEFYKNRSRKDGLDYHCKTCAKTTTTKFRKSKSGKRYRWHYNRSEANKTSQRKYRQSKKGKKFRSQYVKEWRLQHLAQRKANIAITTAINADKIPRISTQKCAFPNCSEQAQQYHHYLGYESEHWFDILPLCRHHHRITHKYFIVLI